jgi:hypothetical protein
LGSLDARFEGGDARFKGFDARVASEVIDALRGNEDVALEVVHQVGEALCDGETAPFFCRREVGGGFVWDLI